MKQPQYQKETKEHCWNCNALTKHVVKVSDDGKWITETCTVCKTRNEYRVR